MIAGWVDWTKTTPPRGVLHLERRSDGARTVSGAGFDVAVSGPHTEIAVASTLVVVATGEVRFPGRDSCGSAAECWLERIAARGENALADARGRYAVVCLDFARRSALLATDRFAAWPLCYSTEGTRLAFSNRADKVPLGANADLDPQAIFEYLYFHVIPAPRTIFRTVKRLDAAELLTFDAQGATVRPHWVPRFEENSSASVGALAVDFRRLLEASVARDASGSEIGCFLSGGTDSSTIAGLVGKLTGKPARTFSIGFDAEGYDEMEYARIAARHFRTEHHEYYLKPEDLIEGIPAVAAHYDQPFGNSSALPAYYCALTARNHGVRTMLAGDGGDELFGGNTRYAKQRVFSAYGRVPRLVRSVLVEPVLLGVPAVRAVPIARKAASYVEQARLPMPDRMNTYNLLRGLGAASMLEPEFVGAVNQAAVDEQQREVYERCRAQSLINRMLAYDWKYTLADNDLPKVRETAHLAGVGVRFPLLDDDLLDFSLALPPEFKLKGLKLRYFFKEALRDFLPDEIIVKRKHGFGLPFGVWLTRYPRLREFAADRVSRLGGRGLVRAEFTNTLIDRVVHEHPAYYGELVWILVMLEQWLSIERRTAEYGRIQQPLGALEPTAGDASRPPKAFGPAFERPATSSTDAP